MEGEQKIDTDAMRVCVWRENRKTDTDAMRVCVWRENTKTDNDAMRVCVRREDRKTDTNAMLATIICGGGERARTHDRVEFDQRQERQSRHGKTTEESAENRI